MANELKPFQVGILMVFGAAAVIGVIVFATFSGGARNENLGPVVIWGTLPAGVMSEAIDLLQEGTEAYDKVSYVEHSAQRFEQDLVEALAEGRGPDLVILSQSDIVAQENRLITIPYTTVSEREFLDTFIEEGELFLTDEGIIGLPFAVDPMILYWNRSLFSNAGLAKPPQYWDEFYTLAERLTKKDGAGNVSISAVALGESRNVNHAKDILSALMMQGGTPIVARAGNKYSAEMNSVFSENALLFYTEFANPIKSVYSWNRSLPSSRDAFLAGTVGVYFGYASELRSLRSGNPNLNFDIAPFPSVRPASEAVNAQKLTPGRVYALSLTRGAQNPNNAFTVAQALSSEQIASFLSESLFIAPARRSLLAQAAPDSVSSLVYNSALVADGWLDPRPSASDAIFADMVESVTTGRLRINSAIGEANNALQALFR
jgi:ABC-type glycerol-3-phosphate transport system substrate-binding protein